MIIAIVVWTTFNMLTVIRLNVYKKALDDYKEALFSKDAYPELTDDARAELIDRYKQEIDSL